MTICLTIGTSGVHGPRRWFLVRVYDTLDQLRAAATRYSPRTDFSECYAVCHTFRWRHEHTVRYGERGYAGVLRFALPHLNGELVGHELVHAACAVYRMTVAGDIRLGRVVGEREEELAYLFGELYASFQDAWRRAHPQGQAGS